MNDQIVRFKKTGSVGPSHYPNDLLKVLETFPKIGFATKEVATSAKHAHSPLIPIDQHSLNVADFLTDER